jgi:hypothetical protein
MLRIGHCSCFYFILVAEEKGINLATTEGVDTEGTTKTKVIHMSIPSSMKIVNSKVFIPQEDVVILRNNIRV